MELGERDGAGREMNPWRRCQVMGCERWAAPGLVTCRPHKRTVAGRAAMASARLLAEAARRGAEMWPGDERVNTGDAGERDERERRLERSRERFQRRVERGEYAELFGPGVGDVMETAARESGLNRELGALRFVLARLLEEEEDPVRLALGVARVTRAAATVEKARLAMRPPERPGLGAVREVMAALYGVEPDKGNASEGSQG